MQKQQILVVEDERDIVKVLEFGLKQAGFDPVVAYDGEQARSRIEQRVPDLVLLDLMLPDVSGTEICKQLKTTPRTAHVPVMMLTARGEEIDRVLGFELGADDFVTKPFSVRELMLRIRAVLRRRAPEEKAPQRAQVGPIRIDVESHRAFVGEQEIDLTALEFKLLLWFIARVGRVQSREQLLDVVWGLSPETQTRTVDTHVKRLREKLGEARELLETVRGTGYRLVDPAEK
ncbi:MAG TPA: response regulator [Myxococcales bacterium]|nr:response regulator [Myxococcales bacterium]